MSVSAAEPEQHPLHAWGLSGLTCDAQHGERRTCSPHGVYLPTMLAIIPNGSGCG